MKHLVVAGVLGAALAVGGCEPNNYHREARVPDDTGVVHTNAPLRATYIVPFVERPDGSGLHTPRRIVCAEPSPDVATALSAAMNASLAIDKGGGGPSGAGSLGFSTAAAVAQLGERLAVIQLLRDKMYRACEAYANGAVNPTGYVLMLARLDKSMTTLLASEMAAGAFGRSLAAISASSSAGGFDAEKAAGLDAKVTGKINVLYKAATAEPPKKADIDTAKAELEAAIKELMLFQATSLRTAVSTASGGTQPGQITSRPSTTVQGSSVADIHQAYIDDDGLEPVADACLHRLAASTPVETVTGRVSFLLDYIRGQRYASSGGPTIPVRLERRHLNSFIAINMTLRGMAHHALQMEPNTPDFKLPGAGMYDGSRLEGALKRIADALKDARTTGGRDAFNYVCIKLFDEGDGDFIERRFASKLNAKLARVPGASVIDIGTVDMCRSVISVAMRETRNNMPDGLRQSLAICQRLLAGRGGGPAPARPAARINVGL